VNFDAEAPFIAERTSEWHNRRCHEKICRNKKM